MNEDIQPLSRQRIAELSALLSEFNVMLSHLDIDEQDPRYLEGMASIRSRCDELAETLSAPFKQLASLVTNAVSVVMATADMDKASTPAGTWSFIPPGIAIYVKDAKGLEAKMRENPDLFKPVEAHLTVKDKAGSLGFWPKRGK